MADDLSCVLWQPGTDSDSLLVDSTVSCLIGPVLSAAPATVLRRLARAARMAGRGPLLDVSALELGPFVGAVPVPVLPSLTLVDGVVLPLPLAVAHVLAGAPLDLLPPDPHTGQPVAVIGLGAPHRGLIVGPAPVHWVYAFLVLHLLDLGPGLAWALPARSYSAVFVPRLMFSRLSSAYALALIVGLAGRGLDLARLASDPQFFFSACRSFSRGLDPAGRALEAALSGARS